MKFGVVTFPGSNCDQDMIYVLKDLLGQQIETLWHKDTDLKGVDMVILPGGFSYGDYLRSGAIAKFSPIMTEVVKHAEKGGYVMGICNGFQILTESGLLEGALLHNNNQRFICKNVYLKPVSNSAAINKDLDSNTTYKIPIAHGEGRFYAPEDLLKSIEDNDQVLFRYSSQEGEVSDSFNPNGSINNIAGITNKTKNVFGMMPHPERAADKQLNNLDGKAFFESILNHCS
ncbi:MAG: phosphoribosylformylglycinamidine synthase subunit PurQ [Crocinitomicaceae bacterium]|jgi:phosphoribosylformylglycinamidine synthase